MGWVINHMEYPIEFLRTGILSGISVNGNNLIIENVMINDNRNNNVYQCVTLLDLGVPPTQNNPITLCNPITNPITTLRNPIYIYIYIYICC